MPGLPCHSIVDIDKQPNFDCLHDTIGECRSGLSEQDVAEAIDKRAAARSSKNFAEADAVREEIFSKGIQIMDTPQGTVWRPRPLLND